MTTDSHSPSSLRERLDESINAHDKQGAVSAALNAVDSGEITIAGLYALLSALLVDFGSAWQTGERTVWEEHLASGTVRTIVEAVYPRLPRPAGTGAPRTALLACPQNETHDLGLRMLSDRFEMAGWRTQLLGADTPSGDIAAAALAVGAELIVLSASTHFHRVRIRSLLDDLHSELPGVRVVVGGAAFSRDCCGLQDEEIMQPDEFFGIAPAPAPGDGPVG